MELTATNRLSRLLLILAGAAGLFPPILLAIFAPSDLMFVFGIAVCVVVGFVLCFLQGGYEEPYKDEGVLSVEIRPDLITKEFGPKVQLCTQCFIYGTILSLFVFALLRDGLN